ncbi:MAG: hypothetical protein B6242_16655 [Anaerolineaceae bacterium 4572_78]|nr:MAG: hypothetical protein B6242_16655 [Anaerolineaceae bacterium 4572_78]
MSYTVTHNKNTNCILVSIEGELNLPLFVEMAKEVAHYFKEYGCRHVLNDLRHARLVESITDIYTMPKHASKIGITSSVKRALVVSGSFEEFHFLETVFVNQGNMVKMFNNINDAQQWLQSEAPHSY